MLKGSRVAVKAGEEQLVSCAAEQSKYCSICPLTLGPCGDLPFTSFGCWQCFRGGADGSNGRYVFCGCGTEYRFGALLGGDVWRHDLEAMARITPSHPNDAMARIASRRYRTFPLDPNLPGQNSREGLFDVDSKLFSKVQVDSKEDWARISSKIPPRSQRSPQYYVQPSSGFCWIPPCSAASFEVNSEPHTGARPSVRLCVGLINHHLVVFIQHDPGELRGL
jgi:hypothetical protein